MKSWFGVALCLAIAFASSSVPASAEQVVYVVNSYIHNIPWPDWATVTMLRASDMAILKTLTVPPDAHSAAVTHDGRRLWVTCPNGNHVVIIDTVSFEVIQEFDYSAFALNPMGIAVMPGGSQVYVGWENAWSLARYDARTYDLLSPGYAQTMHPQYIVFTPDGSKACLLDYSGWIAIVRASDGEVLRTEVPGGSGLGDAVVSPDAGTLYVSNMYQQRVEVYDLNALAFLPPIPTPYLNPRGIGISPDGEYLYIGYYTGAASKVSMLRLSDRTFVSEADIPSNGRRVAVSPDGSRIFVAEHNYDQCCSFNVVGETLVPAAVADLNTIAGYLASPIGLAMGDWTPRASNYINLAVSPAYVPGGSSFSLTWSCDFSTWNYQGVPVDIYLAAIKDPAVSYYPSSVSDALAGGTVWFFGRNMSYASTGSPREPTWSRVPFPPAALSGSLPFTPPEGDMWKGEWVFAAVFIRSGTGQFIRGDGLPVENSNIFGLR